MKSLSFKILLFFVIFFLFFGTIASAELNKKNWERPLSDGAAESYYVSYIDEQEKSNSTQIAEYVGKILIIAPFLGMVFLIRMVWAGYLWMTARGNAEQVADAKKTMTHALIGIIIFAVIYVIAQFTIDKLAEISGYEGAN